MSKLSFDRITTDCVKVKIRIIQATLERILRNVGLPPHEASVLAREYLDGELEGKITHGIAVFPAIVDKFAMLTRAPRVRERTHSALFVEGNGHPGILLVDHFKKELEKMAHSEGVVAIAISHMNTWLRPGAVARLFAEDGFVALVMNTGGSAAIVPYGGLTPVVGTNPIGLAVPSSRGPIVADMATSKRAWGEVRIAKSRGRLLPPETFLNKRGLWTRDPDQVFAVTPMGDYKGFALALFIELVCGAMLGIPVGIDDVALAMNSKYPMSTRGGLVILLDPRSFLHKKVFNHAVVGLVKKIRASKPQKGFGKVLLPGDRSEKIRYANLKKGYLEVDPKVWTTIQKLIPKR